MRSLLRQICGVALLVLLAACASKQKYDPQRVDIAPGVSLELPDWQPFGPQVSAVQLVQARYLDRTEVFQAFAETNATGAFVVVVTLPSGPRIMSVEWRPGNFVITKEPMAPAGLSGEHMLADMMLIYAPLPVLRDSLVGGQVEVDAEGTRRIVKDNNLLIEVVWPDGMNLETPWNARVWLKNIGYGYLLSISSQSIAP